MLITTPPRPLWRVDIRLAACWAQSIGPIAFTANIRCLRSKPRFSRRDCCAMIPACITSTSIRHKPRPEEHTDELQSLMRLSYAVFCLKKNKKNQEQRTTHD